jgi:hypothetical protein
LGPEVFFFGHGEHLAPAIQQALRLRQVLLEQFVELGQVARRHGRVDVMIDVIIEPPVEELKEGAHLYRTRTEALIIHVVQPRDVLCVVPQPLNR